MKSYKPFGKIPLLVISLVLMLSIIVMIGYHNYVQNKNTVVQQQQEHLLTIAQSVSRSLDEYLDDKGDCLAVLSQNPIILETLKMSEKGIYDRQHEEIMEAFQKTYAHEMESILLLNEKGSLTYRYPESGNDKGRTWDVSIISHVIKSKQLFVSKEYESDSNQFSMDIIQPVIHEDEVAGILVSTINLNKLYDSLIRPVKAGNKGYAMVKNKEGVIIMHPVTEQIGLESIKVRREKYPEFDWKELEELNRRQIEEGEGYYIYHSKWWVDDEIKRIKKINAYTTFNAGGTSWTISVQMDYSEIEQPIKGTLNSVILTALIITGILLVLAYIFFKIDKRRKAMEIEMRYLKELNKTWEELVKSESRLRHSQKLQTIGTLTSGIAHEFNNLLTPILGYSELLLQQVDPADSMNEDICEIKNSAFRAKEIIEQILVFSRNDHITPKVSSLRIDGVVRESIKLVKSILPNNIQVVENINSCEPVIGSATQLQQVLLNIYTNSYHAMKGSGGVLGLCVDAVNIYEDSCKGLGLGAGRYVRIRVKDTGIGMDEETLGQIFDPFFTTKETGEGTGLGLSVVHGIVKNHNGSITVHSQVHVGTEVDIYLPVAEEKTNEELQQEKQIVHGVGDILVVDDNISVLKMIEKGLHSYGYHTVTNHDGYQAMELLDKNPEAFSAVILDYSMPNISGVEVARFIKMRNPDIKIILVSGYIKENIDAQYPGLFDAYMLKPIDIPELINKLKQL